MAVGQTFQMNMDSRPLGDIPNMVENAVPLVVAQLWPNYGPMNDD
jgi:hypothetical protein